MISFPRRFLLAVAAGALGSCASRRAVPSEPSALESPSTPVAPRAQEPEKAPASDPVLPPPRILPAASGQRFSPQDLRTLLPEGDPLLAEVGGKEIRGSALAAPLFFHFAPQAGELLRKLVHDEIALREGARLGVSVPAAEVEEGLRQALETLRKQVDLEYAGKRTLEDYLEKDLRTSLPAYERALRGFVLGRLFFERVLRYDQILEERVVCRVITVPDRALAEDILQKLRDGADFEVLARQHSVAPNRDQGGKLPPFGREYGHPIVPLAFESALGAHAGPVEEKKGSETLYHCLRVIEKIPARQGSFGELEAEIVRGLSERPIEEWEYFSWSEKMRKRYPVRYLSW